MLGGGAWGTALALTCARAGRDGGGSLCELLWREEDLQIQRNFVDWANPDRALLPGMYAKAEAVLPQDVSAVVVPETAVDYSLYGEAAYIMAIQIPR